MLQIRLNKGTGSENGAANSTSGRSSGSDHVTVSCPDHLVLADLLVAKGLGAVPSVVKVVKTVGRKRRRRLGEKVHICLCCNFPIAIYGRLSPCEHAFCLTCARSEPSCYLCEERIQKIQTIKMLDGIFICGAPHCLRSFLKRYDFEQHLKETHLDLLQPVTEKEEAYQKDVKPNMEDTQNKQEHADPQVLSRSVSVPSRPTLENPHLLPSLKSLPVSSSIVPADMQSQQIQTTGLSVSPVTSPPEKYPQLILPRGMPGAPSVTPPEKQQHNQSRGSSSGGKRQDHQQLSNRQHCDNQVNTSANPQQQVELKSQVSEKKPSQSSQEYYHRQLQGETQHMHSEMVQISHSGNQYSQQQDKQTDAFNQHNAPYQTLLQTPPPPPPGNPPFSNYPFSHSYPVLPEGQPQHMNPLFDPRFGYAMDEASIQVRMKNIQENNQRIPVQTPIIPEMQDNSHMAHTAGTSVLAHDNTSMIHQDRAGTFSHMQGDLGQVPAGMPMQLPPQDAGMGFNQSLHHQDVRHGQEVPPLPKHRKYHNNSVHGESAANYGWEGGRTNFGGRGYGSWSGPQRHG